MSNRSARKRRVYPRGYAELAKILGRDARRRGDAVRVLQAGEKQNKSILTRVSPRDRKAMQIVYDGPASDRKERLRRRKEQRELAQSKRKDWNALSPASKARRVRFGSRAICQTVRDVGDLTWLNGRIAHERELRALKRWRLGPGEMEGLNRCIGFGASARLSVSNKRVRVKTCIRIARLLLKLYSRSNWHFHSITLIHDGWHTCQWRTVVDLKDMRSRVREVMARTNLHWFGMIELDMFNNWRGADGLLITPHVHLIAWSRAKMTSRQVLARLNESMLHSAIGAPVAVVKPIRDVARLAHLSYYIAKPNHLMKSMGPVHAKSSRSRTYSVEASVRDSHTLRLAEILSYVDLGELMLAHRRGKGIKAAVLRSLAGSSAVSKKSQLSFGDTRAFWRALMPQARRKLSTVRIRD